MKSFIRCYCWKKKRLQTSQRHWSSYVTGHIQSNRAPGFVNLSSAASSKTIGGWEITELYPCCDNNRVVVKFRGLHWLNCLLHVYVCVHVWLMLRKHKSAHTVTSHLEDWLCMSSNYRLKAWLRDRLRPYLDYDSSTSSLNSKGIRVYAVSPEVIETTRGVFCFEGQF